MDHLLSTEKEKVLGKCPKQTKTEILVGRQPMVIPFSFQGGIPE